MEKVYKQITVAFQNPIQSGWFDTDKGLLYYFEKEKMWSCRQDEVSDEWPKFWYKEIVLPEMPSDGDIQQMAMKLYQANPFKHWAGVLASEKRQSFSNGVKYLRDKFKKLYENNS